MLKGRGRPLLVNEQPSFDAPDSQLVSEAQFHSPRFEFWRRAFRMAPGLNRKLWEYLYIVNALDHYLGLGQGVRVLGFGVGHEQIPAVLAANGCAVTATDYGDDEWAARSTDDIALRPSDDDMDPALGSLELGDADGIRRRIEFRDVDMNRIPKDLRGYDGLWSCGSLEHIGGLKSGLDFIERSLDCLRPGGIAVHTTEFNLSSDDATLETAGMSFYRRSDILSLAGRLSSDGHGIVLNLTRGAGPIDNHVDTPPHDYSLTINALVAGYLITSIGLIIQKA
ncbi:MAG: class I SAM-dependent methyltransferase [Acidimicrobiales bacterium]